MSCENNVCGTGGWGGPLPGDPSNDINVTATSAYGGVDVAWSYPTTNAFAVSYAIVYRGLSDDFNGAYALAQDTDGYYFDKVAPGIRYYYWIRVISINGTEADVIGPASATAKASIEQTMRDLTGLIDMGVLALSLKTMIDRIPAIDDGLIKEIQDRIDSHAALSSVISALNNSVDSVTTLVQDEITQRRDGDSAIVQSVNAMGVKVDSNQAAIVTEQQVRAAKDSAMASDITTLYTKTGDNKAAIDSEVQVRTDHDSALSSRIDALVAQVGNGDIEAAIQVESKARADGDSALSQQVTTLQTKYDGFDSALKTESKARSDADSSLAQQITTAQSTLGTNIAQVQTNLQTNINTVNGKVTDIGAQYTVKLNANGLIGGWGAYNNGNTVQVGFDVDTFWIGRTNANKIKPFMIDGDVTYINEAVIRSLVFTKLRSADGSFIVGDDGKIKADYIKAVNVTANSIDVSTGGGGAPSTHMTNGLFQVFYGNGQLACRMGIW